PWPAPRRTGRLRPPSRPRPSCRCWPAIIAGPDLAPHTWGLACPAGGAGPARSKPMNKALSTYFFLCLALVLAMPPAAAHAYQATMARTSDVQRLQDDLAVLEDSLAAVPTSHARYAELRDRADALRQDMVQIRDDMGRRRQDSAETAVTLDELNRVRNRIRVLQ